MSLCSSKTCKRTIFQAMKILFVTRVRRSGKPKFTKTNDAQCRKQRKWLVGNGITKLHLLHLHLYICSPQRHFWRVCRVETENLCQRQCKCQESCTVAQSWVIKCSSPCDHWIISIIWIRMNCCSNTLRCQIGYLHTTNIHNNKAHKHREQVLLLFFAEAFKFWNQKYDSVKCVCV